MCIYIIMNKKKTDKNVMDGVMNDKKCNQIAKSTLNLLVDTKASNEK